MLIYFSQNSNVRVGVWEWMRMTSCKHASLLQGSLNRRIESALTDMPH